MLSLKKKLVLLILFCTSFSLYTTQHQVTEADRERIHKYLHFLHEFDEHLGKSGDHQKGEIQVILDFDKITAVEEKIYNENIKNGLSPESAKEWSKVGVIDTDTYWIWIRDAVVFPNGHQGTYNRLVWKASVDGPGNVAILPVLKNRKIVLNLNYRHSTRSWEIELPRGFRHYGETPEKACKRELREETGCLTERIECLGHITPDSSTVNTVTPVFLGYISENLEKNQDKTEAILGLITLTKEQVKQAFLKGYMEINIHGEKKEVPFRDSFLAFALMQAEIRGLI